MHVHTGPDRIALIETQTAGRQRKPVQLVRYQYTNHLGSAILELDDHADIVSYEEYFPYGSTAYQAVRSQTETPKRYRYTGKERDEENDLYYHGARYYAPWLGRWTSTDPVGMVDGPNLYVYSRGNPTVLVDPNGTDASVQVEKAGMSAEEFQKSMHHYSHALTADEWQRMDAGQKSVYRANFDAHMPSASDPNRKVSLTRAAVDADVTRPNKFQGVIELGKFQLQMAQLVGGMLLPTWLLRTPIVRLLGSLQTGINLGQAAYGESFTGEKLSVWERAQAAFFGTLGVLSLRSEYAMQSSAKPTIGGAPNSPSGGGPAPPTAAINVPTPGKGGALPPHPAGGQFVPLSLDEGMANSFRDHLEMAKMGKATQMPPLDKQWGSAFRNRPLDTPRSLRAPELPAAPPGAPPDYYKEFTVYRQGSSSRGTWRIVTGDQGEVFHSWTHYGDDQPFFPIDPSAPLPRTTFLRAH